MLINSRGLSFRVREGRDYYEITGQDRLRKKQSATWLKGVCYVIGKLHDEAG